MRSLYLFACLSFVSPVLTEIPKSFCVINHMAESPIASTSAFAATYELDVLCEEEAIAVASAPRKLQSGAEIEVSIADLFGHRAIAGKSLSLKKGQNTIFFTATSAKKPKAGEYKFSVDVEFLPRR